MTGKIREGLTPPRGTTRDPNLAYCLRLVEEVARIGKDKKLYPSQGDLSQPQEPSVNNLVRNARLQKELAIETGYSPSKWLLEQELKSRRRWAVDREEFLEEPCFPHGPGELRFGLDKEGAHDVYEIAEEQELTGICFSGGGVRSATFNLGMLQALAEVGLLPFLDYLSSVSGGGYIHLFLASWILRDRDGLEGVERKLIPPPKPRSPGRMPEQIRWLQRYASSLTPEQGILSTDTWTLVAIWFQNVVLNQIPIVGFLAAIFFLLNLFVQQPMLGKVHFDILDTTGQQRVVLSGLLVVASFVGSISYLVRSLYQQRKAGSREVKRLWRDAEEINEVDNRSKSLDERSVTYRIVASWLAVAIWITYWPILKFQASEHWTRAVPILACASIVSLTLSLIFVAGPGDTSSGINRIFYWRKRLSKWTAFVAWAIASALLACAIGIGFTFGTLKIAAWLSQEVGNIGALSDRVLIDPWRIQIAILPMLLLNVPGFAIEFTIVALGRYFSNAQREWIARLRTWTYLISIIWFTLAATALLSPYLIYFLLMKGPPAEVSSVAAFVATHVVAIFAASNSKSNNNVPSRKILGYTPMELLAIVAVPIAALSFLIILGCIVAILVSYIADLLRVSNTLISIRDWADAHQMLKHLLSGKNGIQNEAPSFAWKPVLISCAIVSSLVAALVGWLMDINQFSLQSLYRSKLSSSYLGASQWKQEPEPAPKPIIGTAVFDREEITNARARNDTPLVVSLLPDCFDRLGKPEGSYSGPFPIFCTTVNLASDENTASSDRREASFAFTPLYSGYDVNWTDADKDESVSFNGYVPTERYAYGSGGIPADMAVAISGTAANPSQRINGNPLLSFLLTLFSVRQGWWITNPRRLDKWEARMSRPSPAFAHWYLLKQLFGGASDKLSYINLSDGGHFDNTGLYELVRRRCKFIIVCDAEEDPKMEFSGLGAAVSRCRTDFGVEIDLDLRPLQIKADGFSQAHSVVGTIHYPRPRAIEGWSEVERSHCECLGEFGDETYIGTILYVKSSLTGEEPADILAYKLKNSSFPHDSSEEHRDTEMQFESYRKLGHHIAMTSIRPAMTPDTDRIEVRGRVAGLFRNMYSIWSPSSPEMKQHWSRHSEQYQALLKELRERPELAGLAEILNDERSSMRAPLIWSPPPVPAQSGDYAWQFANTIFGFMYQVYIDLELAFLENRTSSHANWWICIFRRWCRVTLLRDTWRKLEPIYEDEFRLFARRELMLP